MCASEIFLKLTPCFLSYVFNSLIFNYLLQYICTMILTELVFSIWHYCIILIFIFVHSWNLLLFPLHFFFFFFFFFFLFFALLFFFFFLLCFFLDFFFVSSSFFFFFFYTHFFLSFCKRLTGSGKRNVRTKIKQVQRELLGSGFLQTFWSSSVVWIILHE